MGAKLSTVVDNICGGSGCARLPEPTEEPTGAAPGARPGAGIPRCSLDGGAGLVAANERELDEQQGWTA